MNKKLTENPSILKKLKKYAKEIRLVALKKTSLKNKKKVLNSQRGGALLSILLPIATAVISGLLRK